MWDLTLQEQNTEVALERWGQLPQGEPFFKDPKARMRVGPQADVALIVLKGRITLKSEDLEAPMEAPPKRALLLWNSTRGDTPDPRQLPGNKLPGWTETPLVGFPEGLEKVLSRPRADFLRARDSLSTVLSGKVDQVPVALAAAAKSTDPSERRLVVRCFGAIDDLDSLVDALTDEMFPEVRQAAIETLRHWIGLGRDYEYRLYETLKGRYKTAEAENIMVLLHTFSRQEVGNRETYETLIDYLNNPNVAIRELASWHLYQLVPAAQRIAYSATADSRDRERAQREWLALLQSGQIPPRMEGTPGPAAPARPPNK
jgi:hypothetical protein